MALICLKNSFPLKNEVFRLLYIQIQT